MALTEPMYSLVLEALLREASRHVS